MIDYGVRAPCSQAPLPTWIALIAAFFREPTLSRGGAIRRLIFLIVVAGLITWALIAEAHHL